MKPICNKLKRSTDISAAFRILKSNRSNNKRTGIGICVKTNIQSQALVVFFSTFAGKILLYQSRE